MLSTFLLVLLYQTQFMQSENILAFAEHLHAAHEYAAALQEYLRYEFMSDSLTDDIRERMIDCYLRTAQYANALEYIDKLTNDNRALFLKGFILYRSGEYDAARDNLAQVGIPYQADARTLLGLSFAREFQFKEAERFIDLPGTIPHHKSPLLGGMLSLIPGGGHVYSGRYSDGLFSFVVVSLSAGIAYYYYSQEEEVKFSLAISAATIFYAGNIYGGINAVKNYNYYKDEQYWHAIVRESNPIDPFEY